MLQGIFVKSGDNKLTVCQMNESPCKTLPDFYGFIILKFPFEM